MALKESITKHGPSDCQKLSLWDDQQPEDSAIISPPIALRKVPTVHDLSTKDLDNIRNRREEVETRREEVEARRGLSFSEQLPKDLKVTETLTMQFQTFSDRHRRESLSPSRQRC